MPWESKKKKTAESEAGRNTSAAQLWKKRLWFKSESFSLMNNSVSPGKHRHSSNETGQDEHTNTRLHAPETHKRLSTSKSSLGVFIMWRASCYPITPPLLFVQRKRRVEMGRRIIKTTASFHKKYPSKQVTFDVTRRGSGVVKTPCLERKKKYVAVMTWELILPLLFMMLLPRRLHK